VLKETGVKLFEVNSYHFTIAETADKCITVIGVFISCFGILP